MCLVFPYRVVSQNKKEINLEFFGKKRKAKESLVKVKPGDFVFIQNGIIIKKISKKEAEKILRLISKNEKRG